jgi:carbon monoxide dehydrogenase subunit G
MQLLHEFTIPVGVEETWGVLTDIERIAPCMPGARLLEVDDGVFRGEVKVKVGPITSLYRGHAVFVERDDERRRAVLRAEGRDPGGQGQATALISAALSPTATGTRVNVTTELQITGRAAQFGRGVLSDVSARLMDDFARSLETTLLHGGGGLVRALPALAEDGPIATAVGSATTTTIVGPTSVSGSGELDLLGAAAGPVLRRALPVVVAVGGGMLLWFSRRSRRSRP